MVHNLMTSDNRLNIKHFLEKVIAEDTDIMIIQDNENTKKISFINLILSMIKDNELPSDSRLYSSQKIIDLLSEYQKWVEINTTGYDGRLKELEDSSATKKLVNDIYTDLNNRKIELSNLEPLNQIIETKRPIDEKLTYKDLDTSSDESKIKLINLSNEVIDAMTGFTSVNVSKCPEGGWNTNYIADKAIIGTKLGPYYRYKGHITNGHINDIITDGLYLLGSDVEGIPKYKDDIGNELRFLNVYRYGDAGSYIKQRLEYVDNVELKPSYERKGKTTRIYSLDFEEKYEVSNKLKLDSSLMGDEFSNRGIISSGNLYDTTAVGSYLVKAGVTNTPDISKDFLIDITKHDSKLVYFAKDITKSSCLLYLSSLYYDSNHSLISSEWFKINTMNKSKFDGKKVQIFGDGISFGIGASSLSKTSYASLLKDRYGFNVVNNSIGDATMGNYDDDLLKEKSVLTQISKTAINATTEYAIIFAGTNDFRYGKGNLSKEGINNNNDFTFAGSLNMAINNILILNPKTKILLITPLYRARINAGDDKNCDDFPVNYKYLVDYSNIIIDIGKHNHIPVLNLFDTCMINKYNYEYYLKDGLYPNDSGHSLLCDKIFDAFNMYY